MLSRTEHLVPLLHTHSREPADYTKVIGLCEDMKIPQLSKLRTRLSKLRRNLKGDFSCEEALLIEARRLATNNYIYGNPGTWIEESLSLEYKIADAIDAPIGTLAEIFSIGLPNEIWTMVFENLGQHDLTSCLKVSHKVRVLPCNPSVEHANRS